MVILNVLITLTDGNDLGPNTTKHQNYIVCSYGYRLICVDVRYSKLYVTYFDEDAIETSFNDMIKVSEYCSKVPETKFNQPLVMNKKDHEHNQGLC